VVDPFEHPFWDAVRTQAAQKAMEIRRQGFSGPAMLPYSELEYGGIVHILESLEPRFKIRKTPREQELASV
jgi:fructose 1,6-bisphosphate aldolase/phosphatase